jgi:hypothetical protein
VEATSGFEPLNRGFADPRLVHLATSPHALFSPRGWSQERLSRMERKTRFELATLSLARRCSTAEPLPLGWTLFYTLTALLLTGAAIKPQGKSVVPRRRLELLQACAHCPLKTACLPVPPPRHKAGEATCPCPQDPIATAHHTKSRAAAF